MKLEVSHPEGTTHEVEVTGKVVVIGRDPTCDIVLSDDKCSRRHAIIEETAEGLVVRDTGSANGIHVNGRRLERSRLNPGDTVRLGDTVLEVLPDVETTVVIGPGDLDVPGEPSLPASRGDPSQSRSRAAAQPGRPPPSRPGPDTALPLTVTTLALLWALLAPASVAVGIALAVGSGGRAAGGILWAGAGLVLGALAGLMAVGLRARAGWSRHLQILAAVVGLFICPFSFASLTVLIYMLRPDVRSVFEDGSARPAGAGDAELTFALSLLGMLALGLVLTAGAALLV